ncbi:trypsin-like peptidase domain-containing protein [Pseudobacteriovorax antillogorgiicola]|uniref:V8-like Glu-specific endopeptidase n=1 Tax=Pseudobacteriovorax antillogorgiicola TaxID=1513793 RepID=A0A1Y6BN24_9BACT|nr:trypsin-like peptidase domain-containing protein [Pseudobacteriovorax antillogorgiicola]TCS55522.1 V8-like Glu-specific endopeptidase [Pseudobacteriovorax antillogorgiicola]SMF11356.1 V8-like Glu-specific endopeptidase [Pseudobacteriovorax antillogorgiicola]
MKSLFLWISGAVLAYSSPSLAFPEWGKDLTSLEASLGQQLTDPYNYEGIVALSNCSGSLVRFDDSLDTDPALVLTNGHCVGRIPPGTALYQRSSRKSFTILSPSGSRLGSVLASKLIYGTMTDTDMAIYELRDSYSTIRQRFDTEALTIARDYVELGSTIEVISGYWRRGYTCEAESIVFSLQEGDWFFKDSIRYSRPGCEVIGGTSGSPIVLAASRIVVGVNNTINESGRRCQINNPCEIDKTGKVTYERGIGYGQQISWLYTCRDESGTIDLKVEGCVLPQP